MLDLLSTKKNNFIKSDLIFNSEIASATEEEIFFHQSQKSFLVKGRKINLVCEDGENFFIGTREGRIYNLCTNKSHFLFTHIVAMEIFTGQLYVVDKFMRLHKFKMDFTIEQISFGISYCYIYKGNLQFTNTDRIYWKVKIFDEWRAFFHKDGLTLYRNDELVEEIEGAVDCIVKNGHITTVKGEDALLTHFYTSQSKLV